MTAYNQDTSLTGLSRYIAFAADPGNTNVQRRGHMTNYAVLLTDHLSTQKPRVMPVSVEDDVHTLMTLAENPNEDDYFRTVAMNGCCAALRVVGDYFHLTTNVKFSHQFSHAAVDERMVVDLGGIALRLKHLTDHPSEDIARAARENITRLCNDADRYKIDLVGQMNMPHIRIECTDKTDWVQAYDKALGFYP